MAVSSHSFQSAPSPDRALPRAIACLGDAIAGIAPGDAGVFIVGERGTRKGLAALSVHARSPRADGPFVPVSRPELTEEFIERALFGDGTPADSERGLLAAAEGGTLFLEEVCDFPLATQARLARRLEGQRPGARDRAGVRLLAASEHDPDASIRNRALHPELYGHLRVFVLRVPPLRERKGEILELAHECVAMLARSHGRPAPRLSSAAISRLIAYDWPCNVRELEECMAHAFVMAPAGSIEEHHLPSAIGGAPHSPVDAEGVEDTLHATIERVERTLIEEALRASHGNQAKAAQTLGITERLMGLRVKKYGIESRHFRPGGGE